MQQLAGIHRQVHITWQWPWLAQPTACHLQSPSCPSRRPQTQHPAPSMQETILGCSSHAVDEKHCNSSRHADCQHQSIKAGAISRGNTCCAWTSMHGGTGTAALPSFGSLAVQAFSLLTGWQEQPSSPSAPSSPVWPAAHRPHPPHRWSPHCWAMTLQYKSQMFSNTWRNSWFVPESTTSDPYQAVQVFHLHEGGSHACTGTSLLPLPSACRTIVLRSSGPFARLRARATLCGRLSARPRSVGRFARQPACNAIAL